MKMLAFSALRKRRFSSLRNYLENSSLPGVGYFGAVLVFCAGSKGVPSRARCACASTAEASATPVTHGAKTSYIYRECGRASFQSTFFTRAARVVMHLGFEFAISEGFGWVAGEAGRRARHHSLT